MSTIDGGWTRMTTTGETFRGSMVYRSSASGARFILTDYGAWRDIPAFEQGEVSAAKRETEAAMSAAEWLVSDAVTQTLAQIKQENAAEGQEDLLIYVCPAHGEYRVPTLCEPTGPWANTWVVADGDAERCPECGEFGRDLTEEDPDLYWQADARSEEGRSWDFSS